MLLFIEFILFPMEGALPDAFFDVLEFCIIPDEMIVVIGLPIYNQSIKMQS
jgi:hypothetical protein